jgi:sn-glycerol 3-phosphate transport system substrate-binding protein
MRTRVPSVVLGAALLTSSLTILGLGASTDGIAGAANPVCSPKNITSKTTITFWESASSGANENAIQALVKAFNKSQSKVVVNDVNQPGGYEQTYNQFLSSLGSHTSPQVMFSDMYTAQGLADSRGILPIATCAKDTGYSTTSFAKKSILQQTVSGKLVGLPYSASAPVMYYNEKAFAKAHIKSPPTTFAQLATDAAALKKAGYSDGIALKNDPWWLQVWTGMGNNDFVNNANGRAKRATAVAFNTPSSLGLLTDLQNMVKKGDAASFPATGTGLSAYDNLLDIANGKAGLTIDTSAALGEIAAYLPLYKKTVTLGVAPLPKLSGADKYGVQPGGNALYITSTDTPAQISASWEFIQFLDSAANMATWDKATGYVPITAAASKTAAIKALWKSKPYYKVAYTEISTGPATDGSVGPLIGDYYGVNNAVESALSTLLNNTGSSPSGELSTAATNANKVISQYNASLP